MNYNNRRCPSCNAPYSTESYSEHAVTCQYCGFEIVLKLKLDDEIEKLAFEKTIHTMSLAKTLPIIAVVSVIALPYILFGGIRCWNNDYKICAIILLTYLALYIASLFFMPFTLIQQNRSYQYYAEICNYSIHALERQVAESNNKKQKKFLAEVKKTYKEIKEKILTR